MVGVVLIESAPVARDYLAAALNADPDIVVLQSSADVANALGTCSCEQTRVVVAGYHPPHESALDITAQVRAARAVPVILVYQGCAESDDALMALAAKAQRGGVVGVLRGPLGMGSVAQVDFRARLRAAVKAAPPVMAVSVPVPVAD